MRTALLAALAVCTVVVAGVATPTRAGHGPAASLGATDAAPASAPPPVTVTNVTVTPDRPVPGELVTVATSIRNTGSSRRSYWIEAVALRTPPDASFEEYTRVENAGALTPGSTIRVPLRQRFDEPGTYRLRAIVYLENGDESREVQHPVVVEVGQRDERHPAVDVDVGRPIVGGETTIDVAVANDLPTDVVGGSIALSSPALDVDDSRRVFASLERGATLNRSFAAVPTRPGRQSANLTLTYTTPDGDTRRMVESVPLDVRSGEVRLDARVAVAGNGTGTGTGTGAGASGASGSAGDRVVVATVTNGRAGPIRDVRIRDRSSVADVRGVLDGPIPPGESRTARLRLGSVSGNGTVPLTATYRFADRTGRTTGSVAVTDRAAEIALTGVVVDRRDGSVHVTGSASNVGLARAEGVLVSVVDTGAVTPAAPHRTYFVGGVGVSNFVTFDVYARLDGEDVEAIPLRVEYRTAGERRTARVAVPLDGGGGSAGPLGSRAEAPDPRQAGSGGGGGGGGGLPIPGAAVAVVGVVALLAIGVVVYRWRTDGERP